MELLIIYFVSSRLSTEHQIFDGIKDEKKTEKRKVSIKKKIYHISKKFDVKFLFRFYTNPHKCGLSSKVLR